VTRAQVQALPARSREASLSAVVVLLACLGSWSATSASGHNAVLETIPEAGSTVSESPVTVRVVTNDQLLDLGGAGSGFAIVVQNTDGLYFGDGCVTISDSDMSSTVQLGQAGQYTVTYQFVSADGHSLSDSFGFNFEPGQSHVPARGFPGPPVCGVEQGLVDAPSGEITETSPGEVVVAVPIREEGSVDDQLDRGPITLAIAGVLIVLSITLLVWMVRRHNSG
jgi:methionine-rich copper-binding protein CopC